MIEIFLKIKKLGLTNYMWKSLIISTSNVFRNFEYTYMVVVLMSLKWTIKPFRLEIWFLGYL